MITTQTKMSRAAETFATGSIKVDPNLDELLAEQAFASRMQGASVLTKLPNKGHAGWNITCQLHMGAALGIDE